MLRPHKVITKMDTQRFYRSNLIDHITVYLNIYFII